MWAKTQRSATDTWVMWAKRILGRQRSQSKGPEAEVFLMCARKGKDDSGYKHRRQKHLVEQLCANKRLWSSVVLADP